LSTTAVHRIGINFGDSVFFGLYLESLYIKFIMMFLDILLKVKGSVSGNEHSVKISCIRSSQFLTPVYCNVGLELIIDFRV